MNDLQVCLWPIDKVIPYARNSRKIPERAVDKVAASIREFGFRVPIVVDKDGVKWEIKQQIEGIQMKIDIAGNPVSYDSTQENPASGANTALSEFFKGLKDAAFTLTLNTKTGKVEKVEGRDI